MRNAARFAIAVTGALVLTGCGKTRIASGSKDYYPLTEGSSWEYRAYYSDSLGQPDPSHIVQLSRTWVVGKAKLASGEEAAAVVSRGEKSYPVFDTSYVCRSGGYAVRFRQLSSTTADTILALPPAPGKSWHTLSLAPSPVPIRFAAREPLKTAGGDFEETWRADEESGAARPRASTWFAPGVGMVKLRLDLMRKDSTRFTMFVELTRASIR